MNVCCEIYKTFLYTAAGSSPLGRRGYCHTMATASWRNSRVNGRLRPQRNAPKINWAVQHILQPALEKQYQTDFRIIHRVGIDTSAIHAVKTGVRGTNDLVWVGRAANYAAKLTAINKPPEPRTWVTATAFGRTSDEVNRI